MLPNEPPLMPLNKSHPSVRRRDPRKISGSCAIPQKCTPNVTAYTRDSFKIGITLCLEPELGPPTSQLTRLGNTDIHFLLSEQTRGPNTLLREHQETQSSNKRPNQRHQRQAPSTAQQPHTGNKKKDTLNTIKSTEPCPTKPVSQVLTKKDGPPGNWRARDIDG